MRFKKKDNTTVRFSIRLRNKVISKKIIEELNLEENKRSFNMPDSANENSMKDLTAVLTQLMSKNDTTISAESFEKIIPSYDGKNIPVKQWLLNFERNAEAYDLTSKQKYVHARNKMTGLAQLFLESVTVSSYEELKKELLLEFHKEIDSEEIHSKMRRRKKQDSETFHEFVLNMRKLAAVGNLEESSVIKYIVEGLDVRNEAKYLLLDSESIKELYKKYEIIESVAGQSNEKTRNFKFDRRKMSDFKPAQVMRKMRCFNCGSATHMRNECNVGTKCFKCNGSGHIARNCQQSNREINLITDQRRTKIIKVNGVDITCLIDTGADRTVMKQSVFKRLSGVRLEKSNSVLRGLGNVQTVPVGEFLGEAVVDGITCRQVFVIVPDSTMEHEALIGYDFINKFRLEWDQDGFKFSTLRAAEEEIKNNEISIYNIIETHINIVVPKQNEDSILERIASYNPAPIEKCPIELEIIPSGEILRFRHTPGRLPPPEAEAVDKQVEEWLKQGVVRESSSHVASRVVAVKKKDGTIRVCIDYRKLNSLVLRDCFPVPHMEDLFTKLHKAKYYSIMDLENGFFHVPVEEKNRKYTSFITRNGQYEFCVAPFGFCNSPAVFVRFINHIFRDLINKNVLEIYIDDMIIFAETAEECLQKIDMVLSVAAKFNLKIKWKKCCFLQTKVEFLGHVIEQGKIWPGKEKTNAVRKFKTPTNIKTVQSFLGLTGFFRKFIPGYANIARPLTNLLKKDVKFHIGSEELGAIQNLKDALTKEPVLRIYDRYAPTELHTDASMIGFGGVLLQSFENKWHPIFYWSKKASEQDAKKHSYILEVKAAFLAMKKFRNYLLGITFKLVTDCAAFKNTTTKKDIPREVSQWILYLQDFDFIIEHRAGDKMKHADFLSRHPEHILVATSELTIRIKKAQEGDDHIKAVVEILKTGSYEDYKIKGDLLYKTVKGHDLLVIPKRMEADIIRETHNGGHFAAQKTMHEIGQQYWIPHLESKVRQVINNCIKCIVYNKKLGKKEGYLNPIDKGSLPLHTIHVDHLGPMDSTAKLYKYILTVVDSFTKFVWLYPTKSTGCEEALRKLKEWSDVFGNPVRLITDHGTSFTANEFKSYVEANGIQHVLTTTGVARGNGQVERVNRSILSIISKLSSEEPEKWYKWVSRVQAAINSHVHSSTKIPPFDLLFGVRMNRKIDDRLLQILEEEVIENFDKDRKDLKERAKQQIQQAQNAYKKNYDKHRKDDAGYKIGDLVAIRRTQFVAGRKLASDFMGPYRIIRAKRNDRYDVERAADGEGPKVTATSGDNMKLWKYVQNNEELMSSGSDDEL